MTKATTLYNDVMNITIPKGTIVLLGYHNGVPTVKFKDLDVKCVWHDGFWYAVAYDKVLLLKFPKKGVPYPLSYFKNLTVKNA